MASMTRSMVMSPKYWRAHISTRLTLPLTYSPLVQRDNFDEKSATISRRIWCRAVVMIAAKNGARKRKF
jgi:hypothetical protein